MLGVLAAVAAPLVQQVFDRSRARSTAALEARERTLERDRMAARIRTDLTVRVRAHLAVLQAALDRGAIDVDRWGAAFETLAARVRDPDAMEALGASFHDVASAVYAETLALEGARAETLGTNPRVAPAAPLAAVKAAYEPVLGILADAAPAAPAAPLATAARRER